MTLDRLADLLTKNGVEFRRTKTYLVIKSPIRCSVAVDSNVVPKIFPAYYVESEDRFVWFAGRVLGL